MQLVRRNATRLTPAEVADTMDAPRQCAARIREGVAAEDHHTVLYTTLLIAQGIEASGIVRGLHEHLSSALQAMDAIRGRALATGAWRCTALYHYELDAINTALDLHEFQLQQLSAGELHDVAARLINRTLSTSGAVARTDSQSLGLTATREATP
ncbi:hypothetical protein [Melaminivora sp.]|uniref:hypothetical protein n=1 Tax=Melaminivora sp. TaxID=1933032 RepID=UPI0028AFAB34|nr:hypothetical protein [Melaminivora sp.]